MKTLEGSHKRRFYSFLVESVHLLRLSHPNIVDVVEIEAGVEKSYILFDLYDTDFSNILRSRKGLSDEKRLRYSYDIIAGLAYMHSRDVMHLDLKTANILYDGKSDRLVIADFGLSESLFCGSGSVNTRGEVGTSWYRAPEIFFFEDIDNPTHDTSADVWSVGLMILELAGIGALIRPYNSVEFILKAQEKLGPIDQALYSKIEEIRTKRPRYRPKVLASFKKALNNDDLFDLALSMLAYDPKERPSMDEALKNPVFDTVRDISREVPLIPCLDRLYMRRLGKSDNPVLTQVDINTHMIDITWDWLIQVARMIKSEMRTLYLTRHIIDEGMHQQVARTSLQLHGCASFLVAAMVSEVRFPASGDMVVIAGGAFTEQQLAESMASIANTINCDLVLTTPNELIKEYASLTYPERTREMSIVAKIVGLLYLYSDYYYKVEAFEIACSALYYTCVAMALPYKLSSVLDESKIIKPKLKKRDGVEKMLRARASQFVDVDALLKLLQ